MSPAKVFALNVQFNFEEYFVSHAKCFATYLLKYFSKNRNHCWIMMKMKKNYYCSVFRRKRLRNFTCEMINSVRNRKQKQKVWLNFFGFSSPIAQLGQPAPLGHDRLNMIFVCDERTNQAFFKMQLHLYTKQIHICM